ncbi:MAG: DUF2442 domain-containing protein [bacterium]|nr:DUF2442 domain-containing protein [bacterium]
MSIPRKADWFVEAVTPQRDYTLRLSFANGETRFYDARELLDDASFAPLRDIEFFLRAHRAGHSVVWSDEIDISPEYLFEKSVLS